MLENLSPLERLENMGFRQVGEWSIEFNKIKFTLIEAASANNVLYAFVSQNTVMYIGKTVRTLKQRMSATKILRRLNLQTSKVINLYPKYCYQIIQLRYTHCLIMVYFSMVAFMLT